jgi:ArsR family transcriptional regulator
MLDFEASVRLTAGPASYQSFDALTIFTTLSITGTSIRTPTTVATAAPELRPKIPMAAAIASSKKLLAPISADGAATQCASPVHRLMDVGEARIEIDLNEDRHGQQRDDNRLRKNLRALEYKQQHQCRQQCQERHRLHGREQSRKTRFTRACERRAANDLRQYHGHDDVEHDGKDQRLPRHYDRRQAEQERDDRREREDHDHIMKNYRALVKAGDNGMSVGRLQVRLDLAASTLSHHLKTLLVVGLISQERQATTLICRANYGLMQGLIEFLVDECCMETTCAPVSSKVAS